MKAKSEKMKDRSVHTTEHEKSNGRRRRQNGRMNLEKAVRDRYAQGAQERQEALCCPVTYDAKYLKVIPKEILEKDYGCGDPSQYLKKGDVVLDLGSGGGKICYIASQIIGPKGKVIGVDFNPAMLALARKYQATVGERIGWHNVEFKRGNIQDLKTDVEMLKDYLQRRPVDSVQGFFDLEEAVGEAQNQSPLIADASVDIVVSNCVLNLVRQEHKKRLFKEMFRVLKRGGRVAISDIVSDETVPRELQDDHELWSGCISGAFEEKAFLKAFEDAGFYGMRFEKRDSKPWRMVRGIEFRSVTMTAYKGKEGDCWERNQAVIYRGPWKQVLDDDHHSLKRGVRTAVCDKTYQIYAKSPYCDDVFLVAPRTPVPRSKAKPFDCRRQAERDPSEGKGMNDAEPGDVAFCQDEGCC